MSAALSDEKMARELAAQKARVEALKYLSTQGQSVDTGSEVITSMRKKTSETDNTLDLLLKQKAASMGSRDLENKTKAAIIQSQEQLRSQVSQAATLDSSLQGSDWAAVLDKSTNKTYYWNRKTNETSWEKPELPTEADRAKERVTVDSKWSSRIHPASQQEYWVHSETGEKRFTPPTAGETESAASTATSTKSASASASTSRVNPSGPDASKKKRKAADIDPLDFTGGEGDGRLGQARDGRMADSTASGPLWQQRPYPAPSKILAGKKKPDASAGPALFGGSF